MQTEIQFKGWIFYFSKEVLFAGYRISHNINSYKGYRNLERRVFKWE